MNPATLSRRTAIQKELPISMRIPYAAHIARDTVKTRRGDYVRSFRLEGIAHETADMADVNVWHEQLANTLRSLYDSRLAFWTHVVRRRVRPYPDGEFPAGFSRHLNERYRRRIGEREMLLNELYLSVVYRPHENPVAKAAARLEKTSPDSRRSEQLAALEHLDDVSRQIRSELKRYDVSPLAVYERGGILYSEVLEFYGHLVNGEWQRMPLPRGNLAKFIGTSRPVFGNEAIGLHGPDRSVYGSMLGIKEYPTPTGPGILDGLLELPFEFVLSQSFVYVGRQAAVNLMTRQRDVMTNAGDLAESLIEQIDDALDDLSAGRIVMGQYHLNLFVLGDTPKRMRDNVAGARTALADAGMVAAREDMANEAAYWAQLPGNFEYRTRPAPVTNRNFAGLTAFHNFPTGRRERNQWGPAITVFRSTSQSPHFFNFHIRGREAAKDSGAHTASSDGHIPESLIRDHRKDPGNTLLIGPTGSGKTVLQGFLLSMADKAGPTVAFFDKDRGMEIFVRAQGGRYLAIESGAPTGFAPFQQEGTEANRLMLEELVRLMTTSNGEPWTAREQAETAEGIRGLMRLPRAQRRPSTLLQFLDPTEEYGLKTRLSRWTHGNSLGWVFDNPRDSLTFDGGRWFGFDVSSVLDMPEVRTPVLYYLLHRTESLIDGRRFIYGLAEFWKLLDNPVFEGLAQNKSKTIRKQEGLLFLETQSPRDVLQSPIAHTLVEQCVTHIYLPNPKGRYEDYVTGFGLTEREHEIVKTLPEGSRRFLIKQGHNSTVCELDLSGMDDELAVLSGTAENVRLVNKIMAELGDDDPAVWLPVFQRRRQ